MVRRNEKYTSDMFLKSMHDLAEDTAGAVKLVDEKSTVAKTAGSAVETLRAKAAHSVAIGTLAGMGRKMIIAAAQDILPATGGRAARISDALGVLTNTEYDDDTLTDIAEHWAENDFLGEYAIRPLVMAMRAPADFRPRVVGILLAAWRAGQADRIEDAVSVGIRAIQHAQTAFDAAEGTPEEKADAAVKAAKKWSLTEFKPIAGVDEVAEPEEAETPEPVAQAPASPVRQRQTA